MALPELVIATGAFVGLVVLCGCSRKLLHKKKKTNTKIQGNKKVRHHVTDARAAAAGGGISVPKSEMRVPFASADPYRAKRPVESGWACK